MIIECPHLEGESKCSVDFLWADYPEGKAPCKKESSSKFYCSESDCTYRNVSRDILSAIRR